MELFLEYYLKPIKILVFLTLLYAIARLKWNNNIHRFVLIILMTCFVIEIVNSYLKSHTLSLSISTTIGTVIHHTLWLLLLRKFISFKRVRLFLLLSFFIFSIVNFFILEDEKKFNYYTFVYGAFIYIGMFIYESFYQLKNENFEFFTSNNYLLLFAPVLFFFGFSFMFGFRSKTITSALIGGVKLYNFIASFVNVIYYSLVIFYIYREKKLNHA